MVNKSLFLHAWQWKFIAWLWYHAKRNAGAPDRCREFTCGFYKNTETRSPFHAGTPSLNSVLRHFFLPFFFLFFFSFNLKTIFSPLLHNDSISIVTIQRFVLLLKYHGTSLYVGQNAEKTTPEIKDKKEPYVSWKFTTIRYSWLYS